MGWGITQGVAPGRYAPARTVDRAQLASFVARLIENAGGSLPEPSPQGFPDIEGNAHEDNINRAAAAGFTSGAGDGTFAPRRHVRRDQMGGFLARVLERLVDEGHTAPLDSWPEPPADVTLPGLRFDLPGDAQQWDEQPRSAPADDYDAFYRDSFATSLTVVLRDAPTIDRAIEEQEAFHDEHGYDPPDPWYETVSELRSALQ